MSIIKNVFIGACTLLVLCLIVMGVITILPTLIGVIWLVVKILGVLAVVLIPLWFIGKLVGLFTKKKQTKQSN